MKTWFPTTLLLNYSTFSLPLLLNPLSPSAALSRSRMKRKLHNYCTYGLQLLLNPLALPLAPSRIRIYRANKLKGVPFYGTRVYFKSHALFAPVGVNHLIFHAVEALMEPAGMFYSIKGLNQVFPSSSDDAVNNGGAPPSSNITRQI